MHSAADFAWLIPLLPLCGAVLVGLGLISFNDLFNRSRKPVAITLLTSVGASAFISYAVLVEQLSGKPPAEHLFIWASAGSFELSVSGSHARSCHDNCFLGNDLFPWLYGT